MLVYVMRHATTGSPIAVAAGMHEPHDFRQFTRRQLGADPAPLTTCFTDSPLGDRKPVRLYTADRAGRRQVTVGYLPVAGGAA